MKKYFYLAFLLLPLTVLGKESITPTITPALFRPTDQITVTYDVTGTSLASLAATYIWVWIPNSSATALYNVNPASSDVVKTNNAKFVKSIVGAKTLFSITFIPANFFGSSISNATQLGVLIKGDDWANGQSVDYFAPFWDGSFKIQLTSPVPLFIATGDTLKITAEAPVSATFDLLVDNNQIDEQTATSNYSYKYKATQTSGSFDVKLTATSGASATDTTFTVFISASSPTVARPNGIIPGINYNPGDPTKATLCLWAPDKSSVYLLGDFNNWEIDTNYLMNHDGEYFWLEVSGLTSGVEYAFQYLVGESVYMADPYADKVLDPDDSYIPTSIYPSLKTFPAKALKSDWYFNRVSVLQTGQTPYNWIVTNFEKPAKEKLVIYELLIRDFFAAANRSYKTLSDTISYFKRLGVNAIELMPIMEFNGNDSWGYNPTFMFAPDKAYGTREQLKAFIDNCHQQGIAVILDIAMNHQDIPNPYVLMDYNFATGKVNPTNKWFNVDATHPYSVFYDMNHESSYTKTYLDTVTHYWLNQYHVDGYRFDLAKGFTQKNNPNDVNAWSAYDGSRISLLKRMSDKIWSHTPDAIVILELFSANNEEKELAEYRANEGKGMMTWGNLNNAYAQNTMGWNSDCDISSIYATNRGWTVPHLVGYMESHDEERNMFKNLQYGNASGSYSVKSAGTAIDRGKAAANVFYTIPGPKMLWQFGELGYDVSIDNGGRVSAKPLKWNYYSDGTRKALFKRTADLIRLRSTYPVFTEGTATITVSSTNLVKQVMVKGNPYNSAPTSADEMNAVAVSNFNVTEQSSSITFPHDGTWYEYYSYGAPITVSGLNASVTLPAGGYKLYTDVKIENPIVTAIEEVAVSREIQFYPNPADDVIAISSDRGIINSVTMFSIQGSVINIPRIDPNHWSTSQLNAGLYLGRVKTSNGTYSFKLIKK